MRALLVALLLLVPAAARAESDTAARLVEWYGTKKHYRQVRREVLGWHKTTKNACVAFVSTALRRIGVDVPLDAEVDGEKVSRLTRPLSLWLEDRLGWQRIDDVADLAPGDVVFTEHAEYPWHVYVFVAWKDAGDHVAVTLDNQGFRRARDVLGHGDGNFTPFAYALRAPAAP
jgi:cell wall-associated NlpC family hydrolase